MSRTLIQLKVDDRLSVNIQAHELFSLLKNYTVSHVTTMYAHEKDQRIRVALKIAAYKKITENNSMI